MEGWRMDDEGSRIDNVVWGGTRNVPSLTGTKISRHLPSIPLTLSTGYLPCQPLRVRDPSKHPQMEPAVIERLFPHSGSVRAAHCRSSKSLSV